MIKILVIFGKQLEIMFLSQIKFTLDITFYFKNNTQLLSTNSKLILDGNIKFINLYPTLLLMFEMSKFETMQKLRYINYLPKCKNFLMQFVNRFTWPRKC